MKIPNRDEFLTPFDDLFDRLLNDSFPTLSKELGVNAFKNGSYPKCDIVEYTDEYEIIAEIPGLTKDQISIEVEEGVLVIKGDKGKDYNIEDKNGKWVRRELKRSSFRRSFTLNEEKLDLDKLKASFNNGELHITIPRKEEVKIEKKVIKIE